MKADLQDDNEGDQSAAVEQFTAEEIAAFVGIDVEEFFDRAAHADLVPVEVEGKYFYKAGDVRRFLINAGVLSGDSLW